MTATYLGAVKEFLEEKVAKAVRLKRPSVDDSTHFELACPAVHIGWVPPKDIIDTPPLPCMVVGLKKPIADDGDHRVLSVRVTVLVYSQGLSMPGGTFEQWFGGYLDLFNLLDKIVAELLNADGIGGLSLQGDVEYGPDEQQALDYWIGWVDCTLLAPAAPRRARQKRLL